jgi:hypothetical protein
MVVETVRANGEAPVPSRVHEMIAGALDRLSARQVLAVAAVMECAMHFAALQRACAGDYTADAARPA